MFGKGGFDGQFRTTPNQSIRGASKTESKDALVRRAHQERSQREARRRETVAAVRIQAAVRGHQARARHRGQARQELGRLQAALQSDQAGPDLNTLRQVGVLLLASWERDRAGPSILPWYTQLLVRHRKELLGAVAQDPGWQLLVMRLLGLATLHLVSATDAVVAGPLRLLEVFTAAGSYPGPRGGRVLGTIYAFLIGKSYFQHVRQLADSRIPPLLEASTRPPTPMSGEILQMVLRPLEAAAGLQDRPLQTETVRQLCRAVLCPEPSHQVRLFLLPSLAESGQLKLDPLVDCLMQTGAGQHVERTPCLLYSFLLLSQEGIQGVAPGREESYLSVLASLAQCIPAPVEAEGGDSDDEAEEAEGMEVEADGLVQASVQLLNRPAFVTRLVQLAERAGPSAAPSFGPGPPVHPAAASSPEAVRALCSVCHRLLMHSPAALHSYPLLFTLAFRPAFLHRLWSVVAATCQPALLSSSPTPLLAVLSRGLKMSALEREAIAPGLAVFCSLLGYLLVTIHDTEFHSSAREAALPSSRLWMPFSLAELVPMSLALRDVALGLVELAFPESRPAVRGGGYREAVGGGQEGGQGGEEAEREVAVWSHLFRAVVGIVRQVHGRDTRRQFCPAGHWIHPQLSLPLDRPEVQLWNLNKSYLWPRASPSGAAGSAPTGPSGGSGCSPGRSWRRRGRPSPPRRCGWPPSGTNRIFTHNKSDLQVRLATVLRELPFTISFGQRVGVFSSLIQRDRQEHQGDRAAFLQGASIDLHVRRTHIYEDAFDKLSPENEPNLRLKMRVQLVNAAGLDEVRKSDFKNKSKFFFEKNLSLPRPGSTAAASSGSSSASC
jgi:ubiquitin-protein ligase E3 C